MGRGTKEGIGVIRSSRDRRGCSPRGCLGKGPPILGSVKGSGASDEGSMGSRPVASVAGGPYKGGEECKCPS